MSDAIWNVIDKVGGRVVDAVVDTAEALEGFNQKKPRAAGYAPRNHPVLPKCPEGQCTIVWGRYCGECSKCHDLKLPSNSADIFT